jgi:hypothetical protein
MWGRAGLLQLRPERRLGDGGRDRERRDDNRRSSGADRRCQHSHAQDAGMARPNAVQPSSFNWREIDGRFVARVRFKAAKEAVAFAKHFAGRVL